MTMAGFTHFDKDGNAVMVDVAGKQPTVRQAIAAGCIKMSRACFDAVKAGAVGKGDVMGTARVAGIMAVKQTSSLIPLCHNILIEKASVDFAFREKEHEIAVTCTVRTTGVTGVEMEALTGVSVTLLTIYDMCKAVSKEMCIGNICLMEKTGGKSGHYRRLEELE